MSYIEMVSSSQVEYRGSVCILLWHTDVKNVWCIKCKGSNLEVEIPFFCKDVWLYWSLRRVAFRDYNL